MLFRSGAMDELIINNPWHDNTDIGPIISKNAAKQINNYIQLALKNKNVLYQVDTPYNDALVKPTVIKVKSILDLEKEIFGPVLHIATFKSGEISSIVNDINKKGYFNFKGSSRIDFEEGLKIYKSDFINFYNKLNLDNDTFLGIENLFPNDDGTNDSFLCTYEEIEKFFHSPEINSTNLCLLIDLGHLAISSNILKFDRLDFIEKCIKNFGERIFEIHISNNDGLRDLHSRITKDSWQLEVLPTQSHSSPYRSQSPLRLRRIQRFQSHQKPIVCFEERLCIRLALCLPKFEAIY